jgi:hypothetical protein
MQFLYLSQECTLCPASFFCPCGTKPASPCPDNSFAPAGSNMSMNCEAAVFVVVALTLPINAQNFDQAVRHALLTAVADACGVPLARVIVTLTSQARRTTTDILQIDLPVAAP